MSKIFYAGPNIWVPNILLFDTCSKEYCLSERFYTVINNFGCIENESIAKSFKIHLGKDQKDLVITEYFGHCSKCHN